MTRTLNHHAATVLPYHIGQDGLKILVEQKSPDYKQGVFDNSFGMLGGNWLKGKHLHERPLDTLVQEIGEEFGINRENAGEIVADAKGNVLAGGSPIQHAYEQKFGVADVGRIIVSGLVHGGDFFVAYDIPVAKARTEQGQTVFLRELSRDEFAYITAITDLHANNLTTDNQQFGGRTRVIDIKDIANGRFAWGHDEIIKRLADKMPSGEGLSAAIRMAMHPLVRDGVITVEDDTRFSGTPQEQLTRSYATLEDDAVTYLTKS